MLETLPQPRYRGRQRPLLYRRTRSRYTGILEVALAVDFIVASETTRFADTHSKWALTPTWGMSQRLPRRIGESRAKKSMFTAEFIKAPEALQTGLVN